MTLADTTVDETRDAYTSFVQGIELQHIWLMGAEISNLAGPDRPDQVRVTIADGEPETQVFEHRFVVEKPYRVRFEGAESELIGEITAVFGLEYSTSIPLTDPVWEIFGTHNVPLNAWPYFRELVANLTGRMGWMPLTIPTHKVMPSQGRDLIAPTAIDAELPE